MLDHMCWQAIITLTPEEEQRLQQQLVERRPVGRRRRRPVATVAIGFLVFGEKKIFHLLVLFLHLETTHLSIGESRRQAVSKRGRCVRGQVAAGSLPLETEC